MRYRVGMVLGCFFVGALFGQQVHAEVTQGTALQVTPQATTAKPKQLVRPEEMQRRQREMVERLVKYGKELLIKKETLRAYSVFQIAAKLDHRNAEANFYLALTRLLSYSQRRARFFRQAGFTDPQGNAVTPEDLNPLAWMAELPHEVIIPPRFETGDQVQQFLAVNARRELKLSLQALDRIPAGFLSFLLVPNPLTGASDVEVDDADVSIFRAAIYATLARIDMAQVYNVDNVDLEDLIERAENSSGDLADYLLRNYPDLLRIKNEDAALQAKDDLVASIDHYLAAESAMLSETDDQSNDLFAFSTLPDDVRKERVFHDAAVNLKQSLLSMSDATWTLTLGQVLDLGDFFNHPIDLRSLENGRGFQELFLSHLRYQTERAVANLNKAQPDYSEIVDPKDYEFQTDRVVEVDYGDVLAMKSFAESLNTIVSLMATYNADVDIEPIATDASHGTLDVEYRLSQHPDFLRVQDASRLSEAKMLGLDALERSIDTLDYAQHSEDSNQADDILPVNEHLLTLINHWRPQLEDFRDLAGLIDPRPDVENDEVRADLNRLVDDARDLRDFLPEFNGTRPVAGTMPDPTLGGILPDFDEDDWGF